MALLFFLCFFFAVFFHDNRGDFVVVLHSEVFFCQAKGIFIKL